MWGTVYVRVGTCRGQGRQWLIECVPVQNIGYMWSCKCRCMLEIGEGSGHVSADSCTDQAAIGWVNVDVSRVQRGAVGE